MRPITLIGIYAIGLLAGVAVSQWWWAPSRLQQPQRAALVTKIREVSKLQTLSVAAYKKISFSPDPVLSETTWHNVWQWLRHAVNKPFGRAIVFADVHFSVDLGALQDEALQLIDDEAWVRLPPTEVSVQIKPGETEVVGSNLNSKETAQLLEYAREAFARESEGDADLQQRATQSAQRTIELLLLRLGLRQVHFGEPAEQPLAEPQPAL